MGLNINLTFQMTERNSCCWNSQVRIPLPSLCNLTELKRLQVYLTVVRSTQATYAAWVAFKHFQLHSIFLVYFPLYSGLNKWNYEAFFFSVLAINLYPFQKNNRNRIFPQNQMNRDDQQGRSQVSSPASSKCLRLKGFTWQSLDCHVPLRNRTRRSQDGNRSEVSENVRRPYHEQHSNEGALQPF